MLILRIHIANVLCSAGSAPLPKLYEEHNHPRIKPEWPKNLHDCSVPLKFETPWKLASSVPTNFKYSAIRGSLASKIPSTWLTTKHESEKISTSPASNFLAALSPAIRASYSASLLKVRKLNLNECSNLTAVRVPFSWHSGPRIPGLNEKGGFGGPGLDSPQLMSCLRIKWMQRILLTI